MSKKRILFIATEMSPYLELTEFAEMVNKLAIKTLDSGYEVRCIMPRFGIINERRHRLHEVVRLSGINISIQDEDYPLQIKVASLPNARLQVYFLDNEDFFKRKNILHDDDDNWFEDNGLRAIFFAKSALETVKKFGWSPDIVHCSGWMASLAPVFIKTAYKREPVFLHSKIVYTLGNSIVNEKMSEDFLDLLLINNQITPKDIEVFNKLTVTSLLKGGASYADAITLGAENVEEELVADFLKVKGKKVIPFNGWDSNLNEYLDLYDYLSNK